MEVYAQAREIFALFESLLNAPQTKRLLLLREIKNHRLLGASKSTMPTSKFQVGYGN